MCSFDKGGIRAPTGGLEGRRVEEAFVEGKEPFAYTVGNLIQIAGTELVGNQTAESGSARLAQYWRSLSTPVMGLPSRHTLPPESRTWLMSEHVRETPNRGQEEMGAVIEGPIAVTGNFTSSSGYTKRCRNRVATGIRTTIQGATHCDCNDKTMMSFTISGYSW